MIRDDGVSDTKNCDHEGTNCGSSKHCNKLWATKVLSMTILATTVMIALCRMPGTRLSNGDSVHKNATEMSSNGRDIGAIHKAGIETIVRSKSPSSEESICGSLDFNHMPLLLSILRGNEGAVDINTTGDFGYLIPFASKQRFESTHSKTTEPKQLIVPGFNRKLIRRAFWGKRIYFVGDSTSRILFVALRKLLIAMIDDDDEGSMESLFAGWFRGIFKEFESSKKQWRGEGLPPYIFNETHLEIVDVNPLYFASERRNRKNTTEVNGTDEVNLQKDFLERLRRTLNNPDVVIFSAGMHMLHLTPMRTLKHETYVSWVHYESLLEKLLEVGLESGASALIAKSANKICSEKLPNDMKRFAKSYGTEAGLKACQDFVEIQQKEQQQTSPDESFVVLSESQIEEICKFGVFDESGSLHLNERMSTWVREVQIDKANQLAIHGNDDIQRYSQPPVSDIRIGTRLQYFNDHDVESCEFTEDQDGRHYPRLSLIRLHLLAILLDCMLPE